MIFTRCSTFALTLFTLLAVASGCSAVAEGPASVADDAAELNVNVCKKGNDLPLVDAGEDWDGEGVHAFGNYVAATGVRMPFTVPVYTLAEVDTPTVSSRTPFNPVEFGLEMRALPMGFEESWIGPHPPEWASQGISVAFKEGLVIPDAQVEGCNGTVSLQANAKVNLGSITDPAKIAWYCAPGTVAGGTCSLRDGAKVGVTLRSLLQVNGFMTTTDALNLRAGPSTNDTILETIPTNTPVQISGQLKNSFYSVTRNGRNGWVHRDFVKAFYGTAVTTDALNIRALPSTQSPIRALIPKGTKVEVSGDGSGQFTHVWYEAAQAYGFASGVFLTNPVLSPVGDGEGGGGVK